ncbi:MAG: DUF898 domain-containing protein [Candidatus Cloacimonetes bacterium]|nr:DUF898 domain-containing protein [Candidatus Cloacimonadota bacterium]
MRGKFQFHGNGGELFSILILQFLLSILTFGIYIPWAIVKFTKYMSECTTLDGESFSFTGKGGEVFCLYFVQYLLTAITAGLYAPVASLKICEYYVSKTAYKGQNFEFDSTNACDFWILCFVQAILTGITFGLYSPWAYIKIRKNLLERTSYDGKKFDLTASGGEYFSLCLGQMILTCITLGIYFPWAIAKITNYIVNNVTYGESAKFSLDLNGGDLFSLILIHGIILTAITLGIYYCWYIVKMTEYQMSKMEIIDNSV